MKKQKLNTTASDILKITCTFTDGKLGNDDSPENPIARALHRLLRLDGQPFHRLNHCYFKHGIDDLRWLGTFVHSAGDRVIFFPGFASTKSHIKGYQNQHAIWDQPFVCDHASLEKDRRSWHLTTQGSSMQLGGPMTLDLGQNRVLWFGLSIANPAVMREVLRTVTVSATVPPSDSRRRGDVLINAVKDATQVILTTNTKHEIASSEHCLHFSFVVGSKGFPEYDGPELAAPYGNPFFIPSISNHVNVPTSRSRLNLSDSLDVEISCSLTPGKLTASVAITSPSTPLNLSNAHRIS